MSVWSMEMNANLVLTVGVLVATLVWDSGIENCVFGGVYITPGRLSPLSGFTPVPSHGSIFVYMIPLQISCWRESPRREFTPVLVPGREFHSGTKSRNCIM